MLWMSPSTVLSGQRPDYKRLVDVRWGDKMLMMFYEDIQKRGDLASEEQRRMSEKNPVNQSEYVARQEKQTDEANLHAPSHGSISR
jgi:hypothetical protein